jgi:hypothetical protein
MPKNNLPQVGDVLTDGPSTWVFLGMSENKRKFFWLCDGEILQDISFNTQNLDNYFRWL